MGSSSSHPGSETARWAPAGFSVIVLLALMSASAGSSVRVEVVPPQARVSVLCGVAPVVVLVGDVEEPALWRVPADDEAACCTGVVAFVPMVVREALMDLPPPATA